MANRGIPYTSDDLRLAADRVDEIIAAVGDGDLEDGDWRWGVSVEVTDENGWAIGHVRPFSDGWLGFYPIVVES